MRFGSGGRRRRPVVLCREPSRCGAQKLCDQLRSFGMGYELAEEGRVFVIYVTQSDLALARALTDQTYLEPAPRPRAGLGLLRRAALLPLLAMPCLALGLVGGMGSQDEVVAAPPSVEGYRGNVYEADDNHDGRIDRKVIFNEEGRPTSVLHDADRDGLMDHFLRIESDRVIEFHDRNGDGIPDLAFPD